MMRYKKHLHILLAFLLFKKPILSTWAENTSNPSVISKDVSREATTKHVLILGDSLTEGYGVAKEDAYPALLEKELLSRGKKVRITNAGIGGSTTASAPSRLRWHLKNKPDILILALGANDGLRGVVVKESKENLRKTIREARTSGIKTVVLAGMLMPVNYGETYRREFEKMFHDLAKEEKTHFIPFLLEGVGGEPAMNLADGIHPNEKGHQRMMQTVMKVLEPLL